MKTHIPTLLLREWMQHKRGWLIAALAPPLLFLAMLPFGQVEGLPSEGRELLALAIFLITTAALFVISLVVGLFQLPGLARRDVQDRSIEFWLSLPGKSTESVASTVLAHAWLAPLGAACIGMLFGLPVAMAVLARQDGFGAIAEVNWSAVLAAGLPVLVRGVAGSALLTLWLAPLIFVLMAASAWLKRLGVPLVMISSTIVTLVLYEFYKLRWPVDQLTSWNEQMNRALIYSDSGLKRALAMDTNLWGWAATDFGQALAELRTLQFAGWMAIAAAGFVLVVMKRERGG